MNEEAEYLALQLRQSKQRLLQTSTRLVDELLAPFDAPTIVRRHPRTSLAGAALAGLVTGRLLRRRPRPAAAKPAGGLLHTVLDSVRTRLRRLVTSVFGAVVVASWRGVGKAGTKQASDAASAVGSDGLAADGLASNHVAAPVVDDVTR
jgi:hypothetical protein